MLSKLLIFCLIAFAASSKHRYISLAIFLILISISPLLRLLLDMQSTSSIYVIYLLIFFIGVFLRGNQRLNLVRIYFVLIIFMFFIIQAFNIEFNLKTLSLSVMQVLFIPLIAYYGAYDMRKKNVDIFSVFIAYLLINYFIFYTRAFFDYNFFGVLDAELAAWMYRPSNLTTPIIFSIEVAILLSLMIQSQLKNSYKIMLLLISVAPLILMHSRSAYIIIFISYTFFLLREKKYTALFYLIIVLILASSAYFYVAEKVPYFFTLFEFESYGSRVSSLLNSVDFISKMEIVNIFFGLGAGSSSHYTASNIVDVIYVENAFISMIIEHGIIVFIGYIFSLLYYIIKTGLKGDSAYFFVIIISLWIVNMMSASLTVMSVSILYWTIYFYGLLRLFPKAQLDVSDRSI
jgi:hypothetical protein